MKNISRRNLIEKVATLSVLALPLKLMAQQAPEPPVCPPVKIKIIQSEISNNHGHEFVISLNDLIKGGKMDYSIKGHASHPHALQITNDAIVNLMQGKTVTLASSTDFGHAHNLVLKLIES